MLNDALQCLGAGLSIIPADRETKQPRIHEWKPYQTELPTEPKLKEWFKNGACIALLCGPVSGNVEIIDLDEPGIAKKWFATLKSWNCETLLQRLVIEKSQRAGGYHVGYRHQAPPEGNQKLARKPDGAGVKCLIETRGTGGYCLIAPSPGYELTQGSWLDLPVITAEEREALLAAARTLDEMPVERPRASGGRVGDDYNSKASIDEILIPLGWQRSKKWGGQEEYWVRPGKDPRKGHSATFNYKGSGLFICFTSSTDLDAGRAYDLFGLYCRLWHGGDFVAAAKAAADSGYGRRPEDMVRTKAEKPIALNSDREWTTLSTITPTKVKWLWEPYIPSGMVTLIYGDGGIGKSTAMLALATAVSLGGMLPGGKKVEKGRVIILSAEDPPSQVLVPRLMQMGADLSQIMIPNEFDEDGTPNPLVLNEEGSEALMYQCRNFGANLVIVDPLLAYFEAARNMDKGTDAREWMRRLAVIANVCDCAIPVVHHSNKNSMAKAAYRAMGSVDFVNAARSALMAIQDPQDETNCALTHTKHNLSAKGPSIGYTVDCGEFKWTGTSELTPDMCAAPPEQKVSPSELKGCAAWLLEFLTAEGAMKAKDVFAAAKDEGWAERTVKEAKKKIPQLKTTFIGRQYWEWSIRPDTNEGVYRGGD